MTQSKKKFSNRSQLSFRAPLKVVQYLVQDEGLSMDYKIHKRVGKAQAREEFSTLIEAVASGSGAVQITDYGKVTAVLLSEKEYQWLLACAKNNTQPKRSPRGLIILTDDDALEDASKQLAADYEKSRAKTASEL